MQPTAQTRVPVAGTLRQHGSADPAIVPPRNAGSALPYRTMMISRRTLSQLELGSIMSLLVVAGGLFAFISIADEVREGETRSFDSAILLALRSAADPADPIGPRWLEGMMRDITSLGGTAVLTLVTLIAV